MTQRIPCDHCGKLLHDADQNLRGHKILCDECIKKDSR
jgi:formylmethanofuran dehydrogenase subunit E